MHTCYLVVYSFGLCNFDVRKEVRFTEGGWEISGVSEWSGWSMEVGFRVWVSGVWRWGLLG